MTSLLRRALRGTRDILTIEDYAQALNTFTFQGNTYAPTITQSYGNPQLIEQVRRDFASYVANIYASNGVVFALMAVRQMAFSQIRMQFQTLNKGRPGDLYSTPELGIFETPWVGGTTQDLLTKMISDVDLSGNSYLTISGGEIVRLRPDWVDIVLRPRVVQVPDIEGGFKTSVLGLEKAGYVYWEGGRGEGFTPVPLMPDEVCHWAPLTDPMATYRGMSWLTPLLREIQSDKAMEEHKFKFFERAAPQPLTSRVLTPTGWSTMGEMSLGTEVVGSDGKAHRVVGVFPQGERDIYRVNFADGSQVECTEDHLWSVASHYDRKLGRTRELSLREIITNGFRYASGPAKWAVPLMDPVEYDEQGELPIDPYLLGLLLGDGSFRGNRQGSGAITLAAHAVDADDTAALVAPLLPDGVTPTRRDRGGWSEFYFGAKYGRNRLTEAARELGLWDVLGPEKWVPQPYLRASVNERVALLQGLIDSDGSVSGSSVRFDSTSERLATDLVELVHGLGGTASLRPVANKRQWHVVVKKLPEWITPARLDRKIASYTPSIRSGRYRYMVGAELVGRAEAQCIRVDTPDSLYVTDDYVLTHNTPNMVIKHGENETLEDMKRFKLAMDAEYGGVLNAWKTMHLGGGADVTVVGADFKQMDFKVVQGHGETRVAAAAGVPPIIPGFSEGLSSATYSNYGQALRRFAGLTMHPLWKSAAGALQSLVKTHPGSRLWYDTRDVEFLREDAQDLAEVQQTQAATISSYISSGFTPESATAAVINDDINLLVHTGLVSVQLWVPGESATTPAPGSGGSTDSAGTTGSGKSKDKKNSGGKSPDATPPQAQGVYG